MRFLCILLTLCLLVSPSMVRANEAQTAKEGFKEVHRGMKKVTKSVDNKVKKDTKAIDKKVKKKLKAKKIRKKSDKKIKESNRD